jgi:peptidoglycan/xylan/chitin deacetylase (PgdA/CDA1 family)
MNSLIRLVLVLWLGGVGVLGARAQEMAITVDDLPAHGNLPPHVSRLQVAQTMLKALKEANMPPVYGFINADGVNKLASEEAVLKAWRAAGEPLGSHTWSHPDFEKITAAAFETEISKNEPMLKKYMDGQDWHWFRYPFLHAGDTVEKRRAVRGWLAAHDYKIAEVTMDFEDYLWNDPYARCMAKGDKASIARLHDTYLATADEYVGVFRKMSEMVYGRDVKYILLLHIGAFDAKMLPELLELYRSRGFSFISLEEASKDPAYADDPDIGYPTGGTQLELMMAKKKLKVPKNSKPYKELEGMCR